MLFRSKVATRGGGVSLPTNLQQGANGYLAINPSSNNLYYAGYDGNIYMVVKNANFATTTKTFEILKATPTSFYDNAANGLVYSKKHLYYKSKDNQVQNLFYIDIANVANCIPKYLREGNLDSESVSAELLESNNGELRGQVFPNPTENTLTVNVYGKENELGKLEVFDMQGVLMHQENYNFTAQSLDLSSFDAGVYIIKVSSPSVSKPISFKVVKK